MLEADIDVAVESASERLLDDEALRARLTDADFTPLLDWGLRVLAGYAARPERTALQVREFGETVRRVMHAAAAVASGLAAPETLDEGTLTLVTGRPGGEVKTALARAWARGPDAEARARACVQVLTGAASGEA